MQGVFIPHKVGFYVMLGQMMKVWFWKIQTLSSFSITILDPWICIYHLKLWNNSNGQKKGWEWNWQMNSQPLKPKNSGQMTFDGSLKHGLRKILLKATTLWSKKFQLKFIWEIYKPSKLQGSQIENFGTPTCRTNSHFHIV
jgi:hypothetical protein